MLVSQRMQYLPIVEKVCPPHPPKVYFWVGPKEQGRDRVYPNLGKSDRAAKIELQSAPVHKQALQRTCVQNSCFLVTFCCTHDQHSVIPSFFCRFDRVQETYGNFDVEENDLNGNLML